MNFGGLPLHWFCRTGNILRYADCLYFASRISGIRLCEVNIVRAFTVYVLFGVASLNDCPHSFSVCNAVFRRKRINGFRHVDIKLFVSVKSILIYLLNAFFKYCFFKLRAIERRTFYDFYASRNRNFADFRAEKRLRPDFRNCRWYNDFRKVACVYISIAVYFCRAGLYVKNFVINDVSCYARKPLFFRLLWSVVRKCKFFTFAIKLVRIGVAVNFDCGKVLAVV